jgi:hypothetical protein
VNPIISASPIISATYANFTNRELLRLREYRPI